MRTIVLLAMFTFAVFLMTLTSISRGQVPSPIERTFEGQLIKIDSSMKTITIKGMEGKDGKDVKEMSFKYSDATQIVGGDKTIQGLSGKNSSMLKITYRFDRGSNEATRIEIAETHQ